MCLHFATKRTRIDVVDEGARALDLDHGQPLAVARLELGVARDVDLLELERHLLAHGRDDPAGPLAEVTASGVVKGDAGYG